jgi:hypothetical protein
MSVKVLFLGASLASVVAATALVVQPEAPPSQEVPFTGFFSDLQYDPSSGDLFGIEIFISYAWPREAPDSRHFAYVQWADGVPEAPQLVDVDIDGDQLSFQLTGPDERLGRFVASVTPDSLIGKFERGAELRLPRRQSYWQ